MLTWNKKVRLGKWLLRSLAIFMAIGLSLGIAILARPSSVVSAASKPLTLPPGPDRYTSMNVDITMYEWWMAAWQDNKIYCSFFVDYAGLPTTTDVYSACGKDLYSQWQAETKACTAVDSHACPGYYFIQVSSKQTKKDITIKLPPPSVLVSLEGCEPDNSGWCTQPPTLVLTAEEPLPNEAITAISGFAGTEPFSCSGNKCVFKMSDTNPSGIRLTFWAYSTYGDTSNVFDALIRVLTDEANGDRLTPRWNVDVISSQWTGDPVASCAAGWESFPPTDGLPQWLTTPESAEELNTNIPYDYLAANLISQGVTDASSCPGRGLNPDGSANACGLKAAENDVIEWQNRFDNLIYQVAVEGDVPAQLLKNLFSRESQFWPGVFRNGKDVGLGQMTEGGADTALLWNPSFYEQFCPLVLDDRLCKSKGFAQLKASHQTLLRAALVNSVDARCDDCPLGLDLSRANFSVGVFAHTLLANCEQAGKIIQNVTNQMPGRTVDYETLWRLTLVNYNAGAGCLGIAVTQAFDPTAEKPLNWDSIASILEDTCPGAAQYVRDVSSDTDQSQGGNTPPPANP